jgi:phage tail P2-like protein
MTELKDSRFTELLPSNLKNDTETQALAYAVSRQVQQIIRFADAACVYIAIDRVPEPVLDLLAVELRTPVYKQTYSVAIKRALVKESLIFYDQMGTPAAVNRIIEAVFGVGQIEEWWEYNGSPHHFRATVRGVYPTAKNIADFKEAVQSVKRLSSWLDEITYLSEAPKCTAYIAAAPSGLYCTMSARVRGKIPPQSGRVAAFAGAAAAGVYAQTGAKLRLED